MFSFIEFDEEHGYPLSMRQAAYGWLKRWLLGWRWFPGP